MWYGSWARRWERCSMLWPWLQVISDLTVEEVFIITEAMRISSKESRRHSRLPQTTCHLPLIESNIHNVANSLKYFPFQGFTSSLARPGNQDNSVKVSSVCLKWWMHKVEDRLCFIGDIKPHGVHWKFIFSCTGENWILSNYTREMFSKQKTSCLFWSYVNVWEECFKSR